MIIADGIKGDSVFSILLLDNNNGPYATSSFCVPDDRRILVLLQFHTAPGITISPGTIVGYCVQSIVDDFDRGVLLMEAFV